MSAIVGAFRLDGRPVGREEMERMIESLAHRGPDGADAWTNGPVGLGHLMLHTTPESLDEQQPLVQGSLALTADARIDNREELKATLGLSDRPKEDVSDSELILRAYERWGECCPEKLLGDFAFAVWDRQKRVLFCARDHMGVKPFYYHHRPGKLFAFGTEIKALLRVEGVPRRLNETRIADYLIGLLEDEEITFYQGIFRLPAGHSIKVGPEAYQIRCYWSLDPSHELQLRSDEEYAEVFRGLFFEAVHCRLRTAFPVGSLLSGGLDSSAIVCAARDLLGAGTKHRRLHTFSAVFDEVPECDERTFIDAVLVQGGLEARSVRADATGPLTDLQRVLWHEDEAFYAPNLFMHWGLYGAAQQQGVRVLLDGLDGDTTVSHGVRYLTELARGGRWRTLAAEITGLAQGFDVPSRQYLRYALGPLIPPIIRRARARLRGPDSPPWVGAHIRPDFARRVGLTERVLAVDGDRSVPTITEREEHRRLLTSGLIGFYLEVADKAAAAFSIEPRYPFFDRRLIEFCLALPPEQKLSGGWTRMILRRALAGSLPDKIRWRAGKTNLGPNFRRGLLKHDRELLDEVIINDSGAIEEYVDTAALRETYERFAHRGEQGKALAIWKPASLALWLRQAQLSPNGRTPSDP